MQQKSPISHQYIFLCIMGINSSCACLACSSALFLHTRVSTPKMPGTFLPCVFPRFNEASEIAEAVPSSDDSLNTIYIYMHLWLLVADGRKMKDT